MKADTSTATKQDIAEVRKDITDVLDVMQEGFAQFGEFANHTEEHFAKIDGRLDGIDSRLDGMDSRLDGIDGRLDGIDSRLDGVNNRMGRLDQRLLSLENAFEVFKNEQLAMSADIKDLLRQLDVIDRQIKNGQYKQEELEQKLVALHDWVEKAADKIGLQFPAKR